ncbi:MAG: energy transducer TonB [Bacteroidales bacterium]|nr:energy transducer TonB [Bacteroidales bacterium]
MLLLLMICTSVTGQNRNSCILSDSARFAEFIYVNMRYPLMAYINRVEGTAVYQVEFERSGRINKIETIHSIGSGLDTEGRRLIHAIPWQEREPHRDTTREISIHFNLADHKIYDMAEIVKMRERGEMPEFPGGFEDMRNFIGRNLRWPPEGREMSIQGTIYCGVIIEKDGTIGIIEILRSLHHWFDAEAMRVIKRMPKWTPGKIDEKPVRVQVLIPIRFTLSG